MGSGLRGRTPALGSRTQGERSKAALNAKHCPFPSALPLIFNSFLSPSHALLFPQQVRSPHSLLTATTACDNAHALPTPVAHAPWRRSLVILKRSVRISAGSK